MIRDDLIKLQAYIISAGDAHIRMAVDAILLEHRDEADKLKAVQQELKEYYHGKQNRSDTVAHSEQSQSAD
ncbi:hypothetical protein L1281_001752 [Neisseria sp. HSC-16F19]|nr:hypothetical protein [Neisseria sp. HSC-16F19]